ncbi:MAG TPA: substrate-binding domain-containing protein [Candidatus Merdenecus merdavium]|nr:substrate-binding domain-containing protein [Candidatus Merdenecus merdavium]
MGKIEKVFLTATFLVMLVLFILSSTDWVIKEQDEKVHQISVIVNDSVDDYWMNYKKGMEKAAKIWNAEVDFITISYRGDLLNQMEIIASELDSQADALVISPVDSEILKRYLNDIFVGIPVITIGADIEAEATSCNIGADYYEMGKTLGQKIIQDHDQEPLHVVAIQQGDRRTDTDQLYLGLKEQMEEQNIEVSRIYSKEKVFVESYIRSKRNQNVKEVLVFLDVYSMDQSIELFYNPSEEIFKGIDVYGVGYNDKILYYLDKEVLKGIIAVSDYYMGYMSIEKAKEIIKNKWNQRRIILEYEYLEPEDIYDKDKEVLLFPRS